MPTLSKTQKRLAIISGCILLLVILFYLFVNYWANNRLPKILGEKVESKNIDISIIGNRIKFYEPSVLIDSTSKAPELMLDASAKSILINGFSLWDLLFSNEINVDYFILDSLTVNMELPEKKSPDSEQEELNVFVKDVFNQIKVSHFEIINSAFLGSKNKDTLYEIRKFDLSADGIVLDTATATNPFPLQFDKSSVTIGGFFLKVGEEYTLTGENVLVEDTAFSVENLKFKSIYTKEEFVQKHPYEKARLDVTVDYLGLRQLIWDIKGGKLDIESPKALFERPRINVFKDKTPPQEPKHVKPLLTTIIQQLPFGVTIDTVVFKNGYIAYEQAPVEYPRAGVITFEDLYMTGYNLTNDSARIQEISITTLDVLCQFMGEGKLNTTIKLLMNTNDGGFEVSGRLGEMPVTYLNQVLVPLAGAEAEGQVHEVSFEFKGDNFNSKGHLTFLYEDLNITIVDDQRDRQWLKSMIGNIALRNTNTKTQDADDYQKGEIYFVRYKNKSFWNYLWNSVRTGLMDVVVPFYSHPDKDLERGGEPKYKEDE